jgi:hypothetical protein
MSRPVVSRTPSLPGSCNPLRCRTTRTGGMVAVDDGGLGVEHTGRARAHEVSGDHFGGAGVVDLALQVGVQGDLAHELVDLVTLTASAASG